MENQKLDGRQLEEKWLDIEESYRRKYPNLTAEDLKYKEGEFDTLPERIAKRTNRNNDQVRKEIRDWENEQNYREEKTYREDI